MVEKFPTVLEKLYLDLIDAIVERRWQKTRLVIQFVRGFIPGA